MERVRPKTEVGGGAGSRMADCNLEMEGVYYSGVEFGAGTALLGYSTWWCNNGISACAFWLIFFNLLLLSQRG